MKFTYAVLVAEDPLEVHIQVCERRAANKE